FTEDQLTQYFTNHSQWRGEIMIHARNGREVWSDTTILPVFDANKKLEGIFALSLDITDKKNFEKELWFHQQKLGFVVDNLQVGLWEWDVEKQEAWFNDHWPKMLGFDASELPRDRRAWTDFVHPDDYQRVLEEIRFHVKNKTPSLVCIQRFRQKSGKWLTVMTKGGVSEYDQNNRPVKFIGINHDISAISRLEEFSSQIQDLAKMGVWEIDLQTQHILWSRKLYDIFGVSTDYDVRTAKELINESYYDTLKKA